MRLRAAAYKKGWLASRQLPCPVVSIGNIMLGGAGKTPHVIAVAEWLLTQGLRPAIVSRGYGRKKTIDAPLIVSEGKGAVCNPENGGDEPVMMAEATRGIPIVVGSDRFEAGMTAYRELGAEAVILDDGFQHLSLERDINIALLPAARPFGTGRVFPGGDLREPVSALERADALVITSAQAVSVPGIQDLLSKIHEMVPAVPAFSSKTEVKGLKGVGRGLEIDINDICGKAVFAFCAIAHPRSFFDTLSSTGADLKGEKAFRDHHAYNLDDLKEIIAASIKDRAAYIVTTEKDAIKLKYLLPLVPEGLKEKAPALLTLRIKAVPDTGLFRFIKDRLRL